MIRRSVDSRLPEYIENTAAYHRNFIIYGHNMRTGVMFGTLQEFKEKNVLCEHRQSVSIPYMRRVNTGLCGDAERCCI